MRGWLLSVLKSGRLRFVLLSLRSRRSDLICLAVLVGFPVLGFGLAAATGNFVLPSDDLTQNLPLRILVGHDLAAGHLPLWDPYIWSGTPLLGGFNAGALYPASLLFAIVSPGVAWSMGEAGVYAVAASGLYVFVRAEGRGWVAASLGAVSFGFAGAMLGQLPHVGLVEGLSWLPWILLALRGLARAHGAAVCGWVAALGALGGLVILTGEPRAISDVAVVAVVYGLSLVWRHRARRAVIAVGSAGAVVLALLLGAAQLMPGLAFLDISQRAHTSYAFFSVGSLPWSGLVLLASPYVLGGFGNLGPAYAGAYNLPEITAYVGVLPLAGAMALLPWRRQARRDRPAPAPGRESGIGTWWALVIVGLVLSVAGSTPLGPILGHLPFYGHERLQNRNVVEVDLGLAVLLSMWVDQVLGPRKAPWGRLARRFAWVPLALLGCGSWLVAAWGLGLGPDLGPLRAWRSLLGGGGPLLAASGVIAVAAACLVARLMAEGDRAIDDDHVAGREDHSPSGPVSGRRRHLGAGALVALTVMDVGLFVANGNWSTPEPSTIAPANQATVALGRLLGPAGRFAVYDPLILSRAIFTPNVDHLGVADLNILHGLNSVQGYGSIQSDSYALATGTHSRGSLALSALTPAVSGQLDLQVLLTLPAYLAGPVPTGRATGPAETIPAKGSGTWWFGATARVTQVELTFDTPIDHPPRVKVGEILGNGGAEGVPALPSTNNTWVPGTSTLLVTLRSRAPAVGISVENLTARTMSLAPPIVTPASGSPIALDGTLQGHLSANHWRWAATIAGFAAFQARAASEPYSLAALNDQAMPPSRLSFGAGHGAVVVKAAAPVALVRSVAYAPGWQAVLTPTGSSSTPTRMSPVVEHGLVQSVVIPAGRWSVSWRYRPPGLRLGLALEAVGAITLLALFVVALAGRSPRRTQ